MDVDSLKERVCIMWNGFQEDVHHKHRCLREGVKNVFLGAELLTGLLHDTIICHNNFLAMSIRYY